MSTLLDYGQRYSALTTVAKSLEAYLSDQLAHIAHIDRIACRAKTPGSFRDKASKLDTGGCPVYMAPLSQIQDQIGARVVVFYPDDVKGVATELERLFSTAERQTLEPAPSEFGYFGEHWVFAFPNSIVPELVDLDMVPDFFELQIKTLFQHAWSQAEHDIRYKSRQAPSVEQQRLFAVAGALAWQADRTFSRLNRELSKDAEYRNPMLAFYRPHDPDNS